MASRLLLVDGVRLLDRVWLDLPISVSPSA